MRKIRKYPLDMVYHQTVEIKSPAILLSVVEQYNEIVLYAMVDDMEYGIPVDIRMIGTGDTIIDDIYDYKFIGTVKLMDGKIRHVFARYSKDFITIGEKKEDDISILKIDELVNIKEKGRSPEILVA